MRAYRFYIIILIGLTYSSLHAQKYLPPQIFSVEEGLSSQQITSLTFDREGYLWTGTKYGLNRFDGYRFRQFLTSTTGDGSVGNLTINVIRGDERGNLWILYNEGINKYDHETGKMTRYLSSSFDSAYRNGSLLLDAYPGINGTVWILSEESLTMLAGEHQTRSYRIPSEQLRNGIKPTCLLADAGGNVWIGTSGGLLLFNSQQGVFKELVMQDSQGLLSNNHVQCLFLDQDNFIWIGTKNGLNRLDPAELDFSHFYPGGSQSYQPSNEITGISSAERGVLILATGSGIVKFNVVSSSFTPVYYSAEFPVRTVTTDSAGIIWAGTSNGILKIRKSKLSASNFSSRTSELKLSGDHIVAMDKRTTGDLYLGYEGDSYDVMDLSTNSVRNFITLDESSAVAFSPFKLEDYLVLSEHDIEVVSARQTSRQSLFKLYPFLKRELMEKVRLNCVLYDGSVCLWVGTSNGIQQIRFDSARHIVRQTLKYQNQQIEVGQVFDIEQDASDNLWLGTDNGLLFFNPAKGNYSRYTPYDKDMMNTEHKEVYTLVPTSSEEFLIGTSWGVFRFNINYREFTAVTDNPDVMNTAVKAIAIDSLENIWIGTEKGLFYYLSSANSLIQYDLKEGLSNITYTAIIAGNDENVFLAGQHGLSVVKLSDIEPVSTHHNVVITGLQFVEKELTTGKMYYHSADTIVLPWNRKPIRIDFAVLNMTRPEFNRFRYSFGKIGKNHEWYQLGTQNYVILDRLPPGKYIFRVNGCNSDLVWDDTGKSLVIIIEAPFWRSTGSLIVYITLGILLFFFFIRFWIRQFFNLSRENQEREMFGKQIMLQKEELTLKNKSITDSINYAKRIQTAMLPPYKMFKSIFPSSFILFMPKDIVSGDFYWVNKLNDKVFVSAVDCTGHGVPGAFMSIIGFELFRRITNIEGLSRPSDILNRLNEDFHVIFKDVENVVLRDGMDVAFCSIDKKDRILEFAGAFNPLYLIRDNKIMEIKGDRFAIGLDETNFMEQTFKNHIIPLQKGDIVYIFSDGFADQFGGPDGKKYKYRRFRHLLLTLHQLPMEKQHEILENNVMEWRGEQDQVDDILVIGIQIDF
jgi:ligand-binding sensor domain-containing protein/serine phosphatase RsbU (regulator of sigma subunit)